MPPQEVVDEGLFTWPSDDPRLIASRRDGELSFPARPGEETVLFQGTEGNPARVWRFRGPGVRPEEISGQTIMYYRKTGQFPNPRALRGNSACDCCVLIDAG